MGTINICSYYLGVRSGQTRAKNCSRLNIYPGLLQTVPYYINCTSVISSRAPLHSVTLSNGAVPVPLCCHLPRAVSVKGPAVAKKLSKNPLGCCQFIKLGSGAFSRWRWQFWMLIKLLSDINSQAKVMGKTVWMAWMRLSFWTRALFLLPLNCISFCWDGSPFLQLPSPPHPNHVCVCVRVCARVCAHMHTCMNVPVSLFTLPLLSPLIVVFFIWNLRFPPRAYLCFVMFLLFTYHFLLKISMPGISFF